MYTLTIDSGTTNTRATVWHGDAVLSRASRQVGVRDTAVTGNKTMLQNGVRETIDVALQRAQLSLSDVGLVLAAGMITSNVGLHELRHLAAPAGIDELAAGMQQADIPQVCALPIWFIPGVRNDVQNIGLHNCESMDMMRGEETEVIGLIGRMGITEPAVVVLPGSHSKFVHLDGQQKITGCVTTLAGELLHVITHNTILADSLGSDFVETIDREMLLEGARSASSIGLGRACFSVRILDQFTIYDRNARASFLLGAVLGADLLTLKNSTALRMSPETQLLVTGKPMLRQGLELLISADDFFSGRVRNVSDEQQADMSGVGAIRIARQRGLLGPG